MPRPPRPVQGRLIIPIAVMFFLSGAASLLYEVVWFRRLHLVFGVSVFAIGAVVAAFMLGLAAGSHWAASSLRLRRNPLRLYALLEVGIAVYAVLFPLLIQALEAVYVVLFRGFEGQFLLLSVLRFVLGLLLLLPPTFFMGATLPALAQAVVRRPEGTARAAGWLYAINTLGGVIGTLAAGFYTLEHLGISGSLIAGLCVNLAVALVAFVLSRRPGAATPHSEVEPAAAGGHRLPDRNGWLFKLALGVVAVTGLVSMAQEIIWTRALVFFVHNSTYAFSSILAVYLLGLAAGASVGSRIAGGGRNPIAWLAGVLFAASLSTIAAIAVYRHLPALAEPILGGRLDSSLAGLDATNVWVVRSWLTALMGIFLQVAAVLFLPSFFFGMIFPIAVWMLQQTGVSPARLVGRLYTANTVGCVLGTILGTFVLVSLLGTRGSLLLLAWMPAAPALLAAWQSRSRRRAMSAAAAGGVLMIAAGLVAAPSGMYRQLFADRFGEVIWFSEGVSETVAICEHDDGSAWIHYSDGRGASGTTSYRGRMALRALAASPPS
ncbi:MAG: hypothetical protein GF355_11730 [Candidatus Eisenbacteria bacterium]|nr:hypothetical protein [Candidatus Eisenbacteria bacterium]